MGKLVSDWILKAGYAGKIRLALGFTLILVATAQSGLLHNSTEFPGTTKWGGNWGTATGKYGQFTCPTCHGPHSTNIKRIKPSITNPVLINWSSSGSAALTVNFQNVTSMGSDLIAHSTSLRVCEACHSRNKYHNYNSAKNTDNSHNNFKDCTGCHPHNIGFKGNESPGGIACATCHNANTLYSTMNADTTTYHHRMQSDAATYPVNATPADTDKRCLQCHVDHNIFRPDLNTANTTGRSANLRVDILTAGATGAPGTTYTNTDFVATATNGGLCISCHQNVQTKNTANQKTDATTATPAIPYVGGSKTDFQNSPHQFVATSQFTKDSSIFNANCSKCHDGTFANNYQTGTNQFNNHASTERRISAAMGLSPLTDPVEEKLCYRCHARTTDTAVTNKTTANKDWYGVAAMSGLAELIYNEVTVNTFLHPVNATLGLHKPYDEGRAANDGTLSGANRHVTCSDCHNPHSVQQIASGVLTGTLSSYTNGGTTANDTLTVSGTPWGANAYVGWSVKIISGTGAGLSSVIFSNTANTLSAKFSTSGATLDSTSKFIIFKQGTTDGNKIGNSQIGVWGVAPTWVVQPTPPTWNDSAGAGGAGVADAAEEITTQFNAISAWNRTESATIEGQICIKCHSAYAYGTTPPNSPSGQPTGSATLASNTASGIAMKEGDKANEVSTNNLGYHPIFARGMNQPVRANYGNTALTSAVNTAWPKYSAGTITVASGVATLTGGATLPATTLPGWFVYIGATAPTANAATGASSLQTPGTATTGYLEIVSITSSTQFNVRAETGGTWPNVTYNTPSVTGTTSWFLTAGLGNNFVPPWGPWSTMQCTDCHASDTATDPMGPHGSASKFILIKSVTKTFNYWTGTAVAAQTNAPVDGDNFCINCHRKDVYGDYGVAGANPTWSRQAHPIDSSGTARSLGKKTRWGSVCMNCHAGARAGAIHGLNLGKGGAAGSYSGKRLLAGAVWYGVTRSTTTTAGTCYVKSATTDAVSNCGNSSNGTFQGTGGTGGTGTAQYQFDDATP